MSLAKCTAGSMSEFPELSTKSIEIYSKSGRLKIRAHIIMKERVSIGGTWFTRNKYATTLAFKVALCSTPNATETYIRESLYEDGEHLRTINNKTKQEVLINVGAEMAVRGLKPTLGDLKQYFYKLQGSVKYYQIPFFVEFELENTPEFLELFLIPKILSGPQPPSVRKNRYIKRDVILENGKVPASTIALVSNGTVWTGATRQVGNSLKAGPSATPQAARTFFGNLEMNGIPNTKIKDFRIGNAIAQSSFGPSPQLVRRDLPQFNRLEKINEKNASFSQMFKTTNIFDIPTFAFSINFDSLLGKHLKLSELIGTAANKNLKQFAKLNELRILRREVMIDQDNYLVPIGRTQIVGTLSNLDGAVNGQNSRRSNVEVIHRLISAQSVISSVSHFGFTDSRMELTPGKKYQYGFEVDFEDQSDTVINSSKNNLNKAIRGLRKFLVKAIPKFNSASGTYKATFRAQNRKSPFLVDAIGSLIQALAYSQTSPEIAASVRFLTNISSVDTGDPDGIRFLLLLMERTSDKLAALTRPFAKPLTQVTNKAGGGQGKNFKRQALTYFFDDYYDISFNKYGYDFLAIVGVDGKTPDQIDKNVTYSPLRTLTSTQYLERTQAEVRKYFKEDLAAESNKFSNAITDINGDSYNPNDSVANTQFSYLTPSGVKMSGVKLEQLRALDHSIAETKVVKEGKPRYFDNLSCDVGQAKRSDFNDLISEIALARTDPGAQPRTLLDMSGVNTRRAAALQLSDRVSENMRLFFRKSSVVVKNSGPPKGIGVKNIPDISIPCPEVPAPTNPNAPPAAPGVKNVPKISAPCPPRMTFKSYSQKSTTEKSTDLVETSSTKKKVKEDNRYLFAFFSDTQMRNKDETIEMFDLNKEQSFVRCRGLANDDNESKIEKVKQLPNQIKSLMMLQLGRELVKKPSFQDSPDAMKDPANAGLIHMYYKNIGTIEYLSGYKFSPNGQSNVREPVWKLLTRERLNDRSVFNTLCRIKKYEAPALGIKKIDSLDVVVYDEYFKITNDRAENTNQRKVPNPTAAQLNNARSIIAQVMSPFVGGTLNYIASEDTSSTILIEEGTTTGRTEYTTPTRTGREVISVR